MAQIEFSQKGIDQLNASLDRLVSSMDRVEAALKSLDKRGTVFERVFGDKATFDDLTRSISNLSEEGVSSFKSLTNSLKKLSEAIRDLPAGRQLTSSGFFSSIASIAEQVGKLKDLPTAKIRQFGADMRELAHAVTQIDVLPGDAIRSANSIAGLMRAYTGLQKLVIEATDSLANVKTFTVRAGQIVADLQKIDTLEDKKVKSLNSIASFVRAYSRLIREAVPLDADDRIERFVRGISTLNTKLNAVHFNADLNASFNSVSSLVNMLIRTLSTKYDFAKLETVGRSLAGFFTSLKAMPESLPTFSEKEQASLLAIVRAVRTVLDMQGLRTDQGSLDFVQKAILLPLRNIIVTLKDLPEIPESVATNIRLLRQLLSSNILKIFSLDLDMNKIDKFGTLFTALSKIFTSVKNTADSALDRKALENIAQIFSQLGSGVNNIIRVTAKLDGSQVEKFSRFFTELTVALKLISTLSQIVPGGNAIDDLAKVFNKLGAGLSGITRSIDMFADNKAMSKFTQSFAKLGASLKIVSLVLKAVPGGNAFENFGKSLNELGQAVRTLSTLDGKAVGNFTKIFAKLVVGIKLIGLVSKLIPAGGALNKLGSSLSGLGLAVKSLSEITGKLSKVEPTKSDFSTFRKTAANVVASLNEFARIRVSPAQLGAAAQAIDALNKLNLAQDIEKAIRRTDSILNLIKKGFFTKIGFNIADMLFNALFGKEGVAGTTLNKVSEGVSFSINRVVGSVKSMVSGAIDSLINLKSNLRQIGDDLRDFGDRLITNFGIGKIINSEAFQSAVGFQALSKQVQAFGNLTDDQRKAAEDFAFSIGEKYPQSANEALDATLNLTKAGLGLEEIFNALPAAADLSAVSDTRDLDNASAILIQVTQAFDEFGEGIEGTFDNAAEATDAIARAANNSNASVESLGEGLANVAPIANAFGLNLEETSAILAIFTDGGLAGAEAGTQLKSMLTNLSTRTAKNELRRLGVTLTDSEGNFKDINTILNELNSALNDTREISVSVSGVTADQNVRLKAAQKAYAAAARQALIYQDGLSTGALDQEKAAKKLTELQQVMANAERVMTEITGSQAETERITVQLNRTQAQNFESIKKLAGSYGQAGLNILLSQGEDAIANFVDEMHRLPTAAELASILLDNMAGDVEQLKGSIETLTTKAFLPLIERVFRPFVKLGRTIVDFFLSLPDAILETVTTTIILGSTLATLGGGLSIGIGLLLQFGGILLTAASALGTIIATFPLVLAGLAGLIATLGVAVVAVTVIGGALSAFAGTVTAVFRAVEGNIGGAGDSFNRFRDTIQETFSVIGTIVSNVGEIFSTLFGTAFQEDSVARGERIAAFFDRLRTSVVGIKVGLENFNTFVDTFKRFLTIGSGTDIASDMAQQMFGVSDISRLTERQLTELTEATMGFDNAYDLLLQSLTQNPLVKRLLGDNVTKAQIEAFFGSIKTNLLRLRDSFGQIGEGLIGLLFREEDAREKLESGISGLASVATRALNRFTGLDLSQAIIQFDQGNLADGISYFVDTLITTFREFLFDNEEQVTDAISKVFMFFVPGVSLVRLADALGLTSLAKLFEAPLQAIENVFRNTLGVIFDLIEGQSLEEALVGNFGNGIRPVINTLKSFGRAVDALAGFLLTLIETLFGGNKSGEPGEDILTQIFTGLGEALDWLTDNIFRPLTNIIPLMADGLTQLGMAASTTINNVVAFLSRVGQPFVRFFQQIAEGIDPKEAFASLIEIFKTAIGELPEVFGNLITNVGSLIGSTFLQRLGDEIAAGNFGGALELVASEFASLLQRAVALVPKLIGSGLINLGTLFGSTFLIELGDQIANGKFDLNTFAQKVVDLLGNALSDIPKLLGSLWALVDTNIVQPLLTGIGDQVGSIKFDLMPLANSLLGMIVNAVALIPKLLGTAITGIGTLVGSPFLTQLGSQLTTGDFTAVLNTAANGFIELLKKAIAAIPPLLGSAFIGLGTLIGSPFLSTLGTQLGTGDFTAAITTVATAFLDLIQRALNMVPGLLTDLGTTLGIPTLTKIAEGLRLGDVSLIAQGIADTIDAALMIVPTLIAGDDLRTIFDDLSNLEIGVDPISAFALSYLASTLGNIARLPLETIGQFVDTMKKLLESLEGTPVLQILGIAGSIGAIVFAASRIPQVAAGFLGLKTAVGKVLAPLMNLYTLMRIVKNALSGLEEFLDTGSVALGLGEFFIGLGADVLSFFGLDIPKEKLMETLRQILIVVDVTIYDFANKIAIGIENITNGLVNAFDDAMLTIRGAAADAGVGADIDAVKLLRDIYQGIGDAANDQELPPLGLFEEIGNNLADSLELNPEDRELLKRRLRTYYGQVMGAFQEVIPDLPSLNDTQLQDIVKTLVNTGAFGEAVVEVATQQPDYLVEFLKKSFELAPEDLASIDFSAMTEQIKMLAKGNMINPNAAIETLVQFGIEGVISEDEAVKAAQDIFYTFNQGITKEELEVQVQKFRLTIAEGSRDRVIAETATQLREQLTGIVVPDLPVEYEINILDGVTIAQSNFMMGAGEGAIQERLFGLIKENLPTDVQFPLLMRIIGQLETNQVIPQETIDALRAAAIDQFYQAPIPVEVPFDVEARFNSATPEEAIEQSLTDLVEGRLTLEQTAAVAIKLEEVGILNTEQANLLIEEAVRRVTPVVEVTPSVTPAAPEEVQQQTQTALGEQDPTAIEGKFELVPSFLLDEAAQDEAVAAMQTAMDTAIDSAETPPQVTLPTTLNVEDQEDVTLFTLALDGLLLKLQEVGMKISEYAVNTGVQTVLASTAWVLHSVTSLIPLGLMQITVDRLIQTLYRFGMEALLASGRIQSGAAMMAAAFEALSVRSNLPLDNILLKLKEIRMVMSDINRYTAAMSFPSGPGQTGTGITTPPGRAKGGDVFAGRLYEVAENGIAELLRIGGRTYLIPGQDGMVVAPQQAMERPPVQANNSNVTNNSSQSLNNYQISLVFSSVDVSSAADIERRIRQVLRDLQSGDPALRRLYTSGRL